MNVADWIAHYPALGAFRDARMQQFGQHFPRDPRMGDPRMGQPGLGGTGMGGPIMQPLNGPQQMPLNRQSGGYGFNLGDVLQRFPQGIGQPGLNPGY